MSFNFPFPVDWYFFLGLTLGALIVALVSLQKFHEPTAEPSGNDLLQLLSPRYLTTHEEYSRAYLLYSLPPMSFVLLAVALLGPGMLKLGNVSLPETGWPAGVWPIAVALMIAGSINVPWIKNFEILLRRFAHERAYIPERARATAERLRAADYDFSAYHDALSTAAIRGVSASDFDASRDSIEYAWARLSCLTYEISRRRDGGGADDLDGEMLDRYGTQLDAVAESRRSLEPAMAHYRRKVATDPTHANDKLRQDIKFALRQLYVFLGCAVLKKRGIRADLMSAFQPFGFTLSPAPFAPRPHDLIIVGLTMTTISIFVLVLAAVEAGQFFGTGNFWQPSPRFPSESFDPFLWAFSATLMYGIAIVVADRLRARTIRKDRWFVAAGHEKRTDGANYIRIAIASGVGGYVVMCLWSAVFRGMTVDLLSGTAPYALLPAATGGFYAYHIDNVDLDTRPRRIFEILSQAFVTGFCALVAAPVWLALSERMSDAFDFIALSGVLGAAAGATLAWYIPEAAKWRRVTPLVVVQRDRLVMLEAAARERFGNPDAATAWLREPNRSLGDMSPAAAAADIDKYENVIELLRRPAMQS
jgi:hypothetical protein